MHNSSDQNLNMTLLLLISPKHKTNSLNRHKITVRIRMVYSAHQKPETKVMRHIANLPSMTERTNILQAKYIYRTQWLPDDTLFVQLRPSFNHQPSTSH